MANILISYINYVDSGVLSGGSWAPTLPLTNLQDRQPTVIARSDDAVAASTVINVSFGQLRVISFIGLIRHNLTQSGQWRVRLATEPTFAPATTVYDFTQANIWPVVYPVGIGLWGEFIWGGLLPSDEVATYGISAYLVIDPVQAAYMRIELFDTANPAGYLQAGRAIAGPAWRPLTNIAAGWRLEQVNESKKSKARGGQTYVDVVPAFRRLDFTLAFQSEVEMWGYAYEIDRIKGIDGDLLVMVDPDNVTHRHRQTIYGTLAQSTPIVNPLYINPLMFDKSFTIDELL